PWPMPMSMVFTNRRSFRYRMNMRRRKGDAGPRMEQRQRSRCGIASQLTKEIFFPNSGDPDEHCFALERLRGGLESQLDVVTHAQLANGLSQLGILDSLLAAHLTDVLDLDLVSHGGNSTHQPERRRSP